MKQARKDQLGNLIGTKFGRLTVVGLERVTNSQIIATCDCECGTPRKVNLAHLKKGHTKSCGCLAREVRALNKITNCYFFKKAKN